MTTAGPTRGLLTDVAGIRVGHHHRLDDEVTPAGPDGVGAGAATGCTVIVLPEGTVGGVDVRGGGPGTRETDLLSPENSVLGPDAIVLTGGSAYGLAAADGVMRRLAETGRGIRAAGPTLPITVPIVPAAVIFDLTVGDPTIRPTADFGAAAFDAAGVDYARGTAGAGVGARAGVLKGGVGSASIRIAGGPADGVTVAALMVVNPVGMVFDPTDGRPWGSPADISLRTPGPAEVAAALALVGKPGNLNTTIGVIATDAALAPVGCRRVATAAHDGLARAIRPVHTPLDGDTVFAVATGAITPADPDQPTPAGMMGDLAALATICVTAAVVAEQAVVDAVLRATSVAGIPAYREVFPSASG